MSYEAVIFDRDGVLLDFDLQAAATYFHPLVPVSLQRLTTLWREYGQQQGFPRTMEEEEGFWQGVWRYVARTLQLDEAVEEKLRQFNYTSVLVAYPDALPALQLCRERQLQTAVLSNFSLASIEASLNATGLSSMVDLAAAAMVIGAAKPDPEAYEFVLKGLEVPPESCLLFDNKAQHVEGARRLGIEAYLVDRDGYGHDLAGGVVSGLSALEQILEAGCN